MKQMHLKRKGDGLARKGCLRVLWIDVIINIIINDKK